MTTYYIDPNASGPGTPDDPTDPYINWASTTWGTSNTYLQKRGTITTAKVILAAQGAEGAPLKIGAYYNIDGTDDYTRPKPIIDLGGLDSHGILANGKSYVTIENFVVKNSTSNGITSYSASGNFSNYITVRNCEAYDCADNGVYLGDIADNEAIRLNGLIDGCYAESCGKHGLAISGGQDGCIIRNSKVVNCCLTGNGWGIYMRPHAQRQTGTWTLYSGTMYNYDLSQSSNDGETLVRVIAGGGREITARELTTGTYNSLSIGEWAQSGNTLQVNIDEDPNTYDPINIISEECTNAVIENCIATNTEDADGVYDGVGIGLDISCTNSVIRNCLSMNSKGGGFSIHLAAGCTVHNCISINNENGINLAGVLDYENKVYNNTCIRNGSGVWITRAEAVKISNNIFMNNTIAIDNEPTNETVYGNNVYTEDNNLLYNNGTDVNGSGSLGSNDILEVDPRLNINYSPSFNSPCLNVGTVPLSIFDSYSKIDPGKHIGAVWPEVNTRRE